MLQYHETQIGENGPLPKFGRRRRKTVEWMQRERQSGEHALARRGEEGLRETQPMNIVSCAGLKRFRNSPWDHDAQASPVRSFGPHQGDAQCLPGSR